MHYKFIYSEEELKWFYDNILPPLKETEVHFVSLSARNKYLTEEERKQLELGRTEMFCKSIVRKNEWIRFLRTIKKFEVSYGGYTTKNGSNIPQKCTVCYININPSSTPKAIAEFKKVLAEYEVELTSIALNGRTNSNNIAHRLNKIDNNLMTCFQNSTGTRHWIDFDLDVDKEFNPHLNENIKDFMNKKGIKTYYWIDTKSGYHLLIKKEEIKFNPQELIAFCLEDEYIKWYMNNNNGSHPSEDDYEIVYNTNAMIPLPGTSQADHIVTILNK